MAIVTVDGGYSFTDDRDPTAGGTTYTAESPITISEDTIGFDGYSFETTIYFNETVTTVAGEMGNVATMAYTGDPTAIGTMTVTYDGTEYTCERQSDSGAYAWGADAATLDFTVCPFFIISEDGTTWMIATETAGEHTILGSASSIETSSAFRSAVASASTMTVTITGSDNAYTADKTFAEIVSAYQSGRVVQCIVPRGSGTLIFPLLGISSTEVLFSSTYIDGSRIRQEQIVISSDNTVTITPTNYPSNT